MGGTEFLDLPKNLICIIFSKLPLKPLFVCRCVSPQWRRMISDISFCKYYHKLGAENKALGSRLLVSSHYGIDSISLEDLRADDISNTDFSSSHYGKIDCPLIKKHGNRYRSIFGRHVQLLGTSNGLVFAAIGLYSHTNFYVWNPLTGFFLKLPDPPNCYCDSRVCIQRCGFGYVSATDDYKAVVTMLESGGIPKGGTYHVLVYSVTSQTWTRVDENHPFNNNSHYSEEDYGILVNEKLHWLAYLNSNPGSESYKGAIIVFDLAKHKFSTIQFPPICSDEKDSINNFIGVSEGCLCLVVLPVTDCYFRNPESITTPVNIDLWVMKEDDNVTWTKQLSINMSNDLPNRERLINVKVVFLRFVMESSIVIGIEYFGGYERLTIIDTKQGKIEDFPANRRNFSLLKDPILEYTHATVYQVTPLFLKNGRSTTTTCRKTNVIGGRSID